MERSEYADYLRGRMLKASREEDAARYGITKEEYDRSLASTSDEDVIEIYRVRKDGFEWKTPAEMDDLIRKGTDPQEVFWQTRTLFG